MGKKEFLKEITDGLTKLLKGNKSIMEHNIELITNKVNSMSVSEMDTFVDDLANGKIVLPIIVPEGSGAISYENNRKLIDKEGAKLFHRVIETREGKDFMSPIPRLVLELPIKKPIQLLDKKRSIVEDQHSVNVLTGQTTGASKSASLSAPEVTLMMANGMHDSIRELTKYRGGDTNAEVVLEKLADLGMDITQETLERYSSGPEVNNTLKQFLRSMHIEPEIKK